MYSFVCVYIQKKRCVHIHVYSLWETEILVEKKHNAIQVLNKLLHN